VCINYCHNRLDIDKKGDSYMQHLCISEQEKKAMLDSIGLKNLDELFDAVPKDAWLRKLDIAPGISEQEAFEAVKKLADKNTVYDIILRGAGVYQRYIPPVVHNLASKIHQPNEKAVLEWQSMICNLTGLDASIKGTHSGAFAAVQGMLMTRDDTKKTVVISSNINPDTMQLAKNYLLHSQMHVIVLEHKDGLFDYDALKEILVTQKDSIACVYFEQVNYFGLIEDDEEIVRLAKSVGAKVVMGVCPIAAAVLKSAGECGVDIATGEIGGFGQSLNFGANSFGFLTCTKDLMGKLPSEDSTVDLTKAMKAAIYLSAMGAAGLKEVAIACASLAHYAAENLAFKANAGLKYTVMQSGQVAKGEFFNEFVTVHKSSAAKILSKLDKEGVLGGLELSKHEILWCFNETVSKEDIDKVVEIIRRA